MPKIRSTGQLVDALDKEFAWRIKEISDLKLSVRGSSPVSKGTLIRAGIALLYAHWEGFIKNSSMHYVEYLNNLGLAYKDLKTCFVVIGMKSHLSSIGETRKSKSNIETVEFLLAQLEKPTKMALGSAVDTESNLSSSVFMNIISGLGLAATTYETKSNLIDESLVRRRNKVAHGEYLDINADEWRGLADEVLSMMRQYKTDIENAAVSKQYLR